MSNVRFIPLDTDQARHYQRGGADANGHTPEQQIATGPGIPCRHCLTEISVGESFLVVAHRPFPKPQPYAEVGPVFVHAEECEPYIDSENIPSMYLGGEKRLVRGYGEDNRIVYGTGRVVDPEGLIDAGAAILEDSAVSYVHVRSSTNNCYSCRIERATGSPAS